MIVVFQNMNNFVFNAVERDSLVNLLNQEICKIKCKAMFNKANKKGDSDYYIEHYEALKVKILELSERGVSMDGD